MNKAFKETIIIIVAIIMIIATIGINFISIIKYELLKYEYNHMQNEYQMELEERRHEIQSLENYNSRLEHIIEEKTLKDKK